jgi:hypothetical protein
MLRRPLTFRKIPGAHLCLRLSQPQDHSAAGRIKSIEKSNDLIGNQTRDPPACSIVPQPTAVICTVQIIQANGSVPKVVLIIYM